MRMKTLVITVVAVVSVVVLVVASAVTAFALVGDSSVEVEEAVEIVPVQAEPLSQPEMEVVNPVLHTEKSGYGCPYQDAKLQQVKAPAETVDENLLLTQVEP